MENKDLEEFRTQWKEELESKQKGTTQPKNESHELYRQALYYERDGQPFEAVKYYRKAFKLNPKLEHCREEQLKADFLTPDQVVTNVSSYQFEENQINDFEEQEKNNWNPHVQIPDWAVHFVDFPCQEKKAERDEDEEEEEEQIENKDFHIGHFAPEMMIHIFEFLDSKSIEKCSLVCRCWYLYSRENAVWKSICSRQWPGQMKMLELQVDSQLQGNWRRMFLDKPRPRLDGIYISQNSYIRAGRAEGVFDNPVYKVRYWRYIRFFKDGKILSICSPKHPKEVVPQLQAGATSINNGKQAIDLGEYTIVDEDLLSESKIYIESSKSQFTGPFPTLYCFVLRLTSSYRGWHDRLIVESYYTEKEDSRNYFPKTFINTYKFVRVAPRIFDSPQE